MCGFLPAGEKSVSGYFVQQAGAYFFASVIGYGRPAAISVIVHHMAARYVATYKTELFHNLRHFLPC